jgi:hypothetical protein
MGERQIWKTSVIIYLSLSSLSLISCYAWSDRLDLSPRDVAEDYVDDMQGQDTRHPDPGDADMLFQEASDQKNVFIIQDEMGLQKLDEIS